MLLLRRMRSYKIAIAHIIYAQHLTLMAKKAMNVDSRDMLSTRDSQTITRKFNITYSRHRTYTMFPGKVWDYIFITCFARNVQIIINQWRSLSVGGIALSERKSS